jgi:hypothetical protein
VSRSGCASFPRRTSIGRQQRRARRFDAMRQSRQGRSIPRAQAIQLLDAALGADRRQLIKQYVENVDSAPKLSERLWQVIFDLAQGFIYAYQCALEEALRQPGNPRWKPQVPVLFARLIHYFGTDAKLRVSRFERWIPGKWMDLHRTYLRATELGIERVPTALGHAGPNATQWTIEQEYLFVLLMHQLNTGNLSPLELDWASAQLRAWSRRSRARRRAALDGRFLRRPRRQAGHGPPHRPGFGSMLRYLDTTPLAEQLERAVAALRQAQDTDSGPAAPINQQRVAVLEKVRPAVAPNLNADLRRDPRIACQVAARVRVGLSRIVHQLIANDGGDAANDHSAGTEHIEVYAVSDGPRIKRPMQDEQDSLAMRCRVHRSDVAGQGPQRRRACASARPAASASAGCSARSSPCASPTCPTGCSASCGASTRSTHDEVEAGVSIIADSIVPVTLHTKRESKEDMGFVVDGIDISTIGARFDGLYLPPPSRPDKPLMVKTIIVPTAEYADGRNVMLTRAARSTRSCCGT